MRLKIFNRIFLSFVLFVVMILIVFWFFYFKDVTATTREKIDTSIATDALLIEKEVDQFFSLGVSEINTLSEIAALRAFLHERGFFKTKVRGQLEGDLIDFAGNAKGIERIRIVETRYFASEPTVLDVKRHRGEFELQDFKETLVVARDDAVPDRFEARFDYEKIASKPFIAQLVGGDGVSYAITADGGRSYLSIGKAVKDRITDEVTGIIIIDLSVPYLREFFYKPADSYIKDFAIENENGGMLFEYVGGGILSRPHAAMDLADYNMELMGEAKEPIFKKRVGSMGLFLVVEVDSAKARSVWLRAQVFVYALFIGFTLVSIVISYLLSKSIATPIRKLNRELSIVDEENPQRIEGDMRVPEVAQLTATFNRFIDDVTGYKKELSLKARLAAIGQTTSMIAHDVRRPLASIRAILSILPEIKNDEKTIRKVIADVDRSVAQTNTMLNDILDFSRDSKSLAVDRHNPQSLITASISDVLKEKSDTEVAFEYDLKHKNYLLVDGMRVVRAFSNVISNAIEAMGGKGRMWIKTADEESRMRVVIGNDGPPIPADIAEHLFDPFFTFDKRGGSGLGLAICRRIVEMHDGSIKVTSRVSSNGEGSVTEFVIELPSSEGDLNVDESELIRSAEELSSFRTPMDDLAEEGRVESLEAFRTLHEERGGRSYLLIVDDEPLFRLSLRSLVNNLMAAKDVVTVVEADSAEKALELLREGTFEYVITDIEMGEGRMNGYEFVREVLDRCPDVHIMIHSNKRHVELDKGIVDIDSSRFMGFMPKPMNEADMLQFLALKPFAGGRRAGIVEVGGPRKKVLVLNDDEALRIALKLMLRSSGVDVLDAANMHAAMDLFNRHAVSMVLADIDLGPGKPNGYDFLEEVRGLSNDVPVYMVSGLSSEEEVEKARERGADGYFQLPLSDESVKEIQKLLSQA